MSEKIPCHDPCDVISCVVPEAKFADGSIPITALLDIISDVLTVLKRIFKFLHFIFIYQATDKDVPITRDTLDFKAIHFYNNNENIPASTSNFRYF